MLVDRRSAHDREIFRLALPAFGALAVEPLYILVDTAIVGHLGTDPLGGLAVAGIVLVAVFGIFNFLAYSTTAAVARQIGAGNRRAAAEQGIDGVWLAVGLGVALTRRSGCVLRRPIVDADGRVRLGRIRSRSPTCASACSARRSCSSTLAGHGLPARPPGHPDRRS